MIPMLQSQTTSNPAVAFCVTCLRQARTFGIRYREFLLDPASLFTFASGILLIAATLQQRLRFFSSQEQLGDSSPLYLAAALSGSIFIWWSAIQGIRRGDFTADIPVSLAVLAIAIGLSVPGILTPVTGALLHELSSIPVIANSARLIAWNPK